MRSREPHSTQPTPQRAPGQETSPGRRRGRHVGGLVLAGAVALSVLVPASPAQAAQAVFTDPDDRMGADIRRVRVINGADELKVRVRLDRVVHDGRTLQQALTLWVDTDRRDPGPEIRLATGLNGGTDWNLRRVDSWSTRGKALDCAHDVDINWAADRVVLKLARACLGSARSVRVALKSGEWSPATGNRTDWLGARKSFTAPVPRG